MKKLEYPDFSKIKEDNETRLLVKFMEYIEIQSRLVFFDKLHLIEGFRKKWVTQTFQKYPEKRYN